MHVTANGKISLDHIYVQPDPRAYFRTLRDFDYRIPQLAKPFFMDLIEEYRRTHHCGVVNVLDVGCSYGVNAALIALDTTIGDLYERYCSVESRIQNRNALLAHDQRWARTRRLPGMRFVGLDSSHPALSYALEAGFIDEAVYADLEKDDPTDEQREQLRVTDLVISTGCLGYVTDRTIAHIVAAGDGHRPWMAHFVLRMFPFDPVADRLAESGYETVSLDRVFKQRQFASPDEQALVLDTLSSEGVDPRGLEADGWLYARLHISRPRHPKSRTVVDFAADSHHDSVPRSESPRSRMPVSDSQEWSTRTFGNEYRLPRVPLPTLEDSCERFLAWCAPLLKPGELAETETAVASFLRPDSPARTLHRALEEYNAGDGVHSWLDTFWPSRYLGRRDRIALNANFFFLFEDSDLGQVERAAGLIAAAVDFKLLLDEERVEPNVQRGHALSMEQNKFLFSTTRIPGSVQDTVRAPYSEEWPGPSRARHITVLFRGNPFRLDVIGPNGRPHSLDDLALGLRSIMKTAAAFSLSDTSVGHLTTKARAEWADSRQALLACHAGNAQALDTIESALFCLSLEELIPQDTLEACDQLLHGDSGNRWFDKAVSLVVFGDGTAGINVEHCGLDGTTILHFVDTMLSSTPEEHSHRSHAQAQGLPNVEAIEFVLDDDLRTDIVAAAASFAAQAAETATSILSFEDFGGDKAKELGASPDAFVQMAYQLAHKRAKGFVGATYESIATRQYRHGRTEAMRVVTPEVLRFVTTMDDPDADAPSRRAAFHSAAKKHVARAKECQTGHAPEQHLWELQLIQQRRGDTLGATEPLALYESPGWRTMRDDYLSTSSAPSTKIRFFGFGSTSSRCIGVAYVLLPDRCNIYLSTPLPVADEMHEFANQLKASVHELQALLSPGGGGSSSTSTRH